MVTHGSLRHHILKNRTDFNLTIFIKIEIIHRIFLMSIGHKYCLVSEEVHKGGHLWKDFSEINILGKSKYIYIQSTTNLIKCLYRVHVLSLSRPSRYIVAPACFIDNYYWVLANE